MSEEHKSRDFRHLYEFGPFILDPREHLLLRDGEPIQMTPKAFDTLRVLVENSRHVMSKDELMKRVWPDTFVEESNLAQNISTVRKALGERDDGGQYIETLPKRGYRFVIKARRIRHHPTSIGTTGFEPSNTDERNARQTSVGNTRRTGPKFGRLAKGDRLDRYEIIAPLGSGGMGEVYLARDTQLDRRVALKLLAEQFTRDEAGLKRLVREAKAASGLNHPNILTVYEIRSVDGIHFIATEFIDGETLAERIDDGRLEINLAIDVALQTLSALQAAHSSGIVHRDIKPQNIMLRPDGYVKLLDFGVAKLIEIQEGEANAKDRSDRITHTDSGIILGTLDYMSPEQARGLKVDARSDIFSFGIVLYEMLAGRPAFTGGSRAEILLDLLNKDPLPLSTIREGLPSVIDKIISKALKKEAGERYQSAEALAAVSEGHETRSRVERSAPFGGVGLKSDHADIGNTYA